MAAAREVGGLKKFWRRGISNEPRATHTAAGRDYGQGNPIGLEEKFVVYFQRSDELD
jgi:hypothetical protein